MTTTSQPVVALPGRLGNPAGDLRSDPRADPRMGAARAPFGLDTAGEPPPVDAGSPRAAQLEFLAAAETGFEGLFAALTDGLPPVGGVTGGTATIPAPAGPEITLSISRPPAATGSLPGILPIRGGGMVILQAAGPAY